MSDKYIWLNNSDYYSGRKLPPIEEQIQTALGHRTDAEGQIERLQSQLDNTKALLSNLVVLLVERGLIGADTEKLFGHEE